MQTSVNIVKPAAESANYSPSAYREALRKIGVVVSFTKGVSMRPLIWTGRHYVAIVPVDEPRIGDMLLFEQMRRGETACILHRLVGIETAPWKGAERDAETARQSRAGQDAERARQEAGKPSTEPRGTDGAVFVTRGDNCLGVERIRREDIIGRVEVIYRASAWRPWFALGGKEIRVTDKGYLRYVRLWNRLWPLRKQTYRLRAWITTNKCTRAILRPIYRLLKKNIWQIRIIVLALLRERFEEIDMMKTTAKTVLALSFLACACTKNDSTESFKDCEVQLQISLPDWRGTHTRASSNDDMLYPINVFYVPEGEDQITLAATITDESTFTVKIPDGEYDLFAVCGLPAESLPKDISDDILIPDVQGVGKKDFGSGSEHVSISAGSCSPAMLSITAERQMAWLELSLTGVPENIRSINLYVKNLHESFNFAEEWHSPSGRPDSFTKVPLTQSTSNATAYTGDIITMPCSDNAGVTFVAEMVTGSGSTCLMSYTSSESLLPGTHLAQHLAFSDMTIVEKNVQISGWNDVYDGGSISTPHTFTMGERYFSLPATVINVGETSVSLLAHKPMSVTLQTIRLWESIKDVPYSLLPEVSVQRWALPPSSFSPAKIAETIQLIGWDAFSSQFIASGGTPIDKTADNILAYQDKNTGRFYRFDFVNNQYLEIDDNSTEEFLFYPLGIVSIIK